MRTPLLNPLPKGERKSRSGRPANAALANDNKCCSFEGKDGGVLMRRFSSTVSMICHPEGNARRISLRFFVPPSAELRMTGGGDSYSC